MSAVAATLSARARIVSTRWPQLALTVPLGLLVIALSLKPLYGLGVVIVVGTIVLAASPPTALTATILTMALVLMPDSPNLMHISKLGVTPRLLALMLLTLHWAMAVLGSRIRMRLTFAPLWGAYAVAVVVGAMLAGRPQDIALFLVLALIPYVVGCSLGARGDLVRGVLRGILVGSCILGAVAITEFIRHKAFFSPVYSVKEYARAGNLKANAGWQHPLGLGMFLCLGAFLAVEVARRRSSAFAALAAVLIAGGIFATQERSPIIGLAAGAVVVVLLQLNARARFRGLVVAGIVVLAVVATPAGASFGQFLSQSTVAGTTAAADVKGRSELLELGVHAVGTHPLFGFGYGTGANVQSNPVLASLLTHGRITYTDIADWPLAIAIETGLLGLAVFILILGGNLRRMVRRRAITHPLPVVPAIGGLVAAAVTSFGVTTLPSSLLFVFAVGLYSTGCQIAAPQALAGTEDDETIGSASVAAEQGAAGERRRQTPRVALR